ncbi:biotin/lipoyl-binding protein [Bacillus licheniformis]|nr:biotin/lipoyl-binding protein [Bacillus licheniformis]
MKADRSNPNHIAASMPGTVIKLLVSKGDQVKKGDHLMINEAMKWKRPFRLRFQELLKTFTLQTEKPFKPATFSLN